MHNNKGIINWFIDNPVAANLLLLSVIILGIFSFNQLRKESFPSLEPNTITVSVNYNSGDPKQSEEGISLKVEEALEGVDGIKRITSKSTQSGATITIEKTSGYDLDLLLKDVKSEVDSINNLPTEADKPIISKAKRNDHVIYAQLYGDADRITFQKLATNLKSDLLQKNDINQVSIIYEVDPFISIEIDESKLKAYGLSLSDVEKKINSESGVSILTSLRNGDKSVKIKATDQLYTIQEFSNIPILSNPNGSILNLGDIAKIKDDFDEENFILTRYNSQNAITLEVTMGDNSDITKAAYATKEVVDKWQKGNYLPDNVNITYWNDGSETIKGRLNLLVKNALSGVFLVFIILALFLNLKVAFGLQQDYLLYFSELYS